MLRIIFIVSILFFLSSLGFSQKKLIHKTDLQFLRVLTQNVMDSARILPGQFISKEMGANNTGGTLIRPGGRNAYPSFWIRDYAMSLETGFVTTAEQWHMLQLTAATQCDQTWITKNGSMVPAGAIADHVRIDNSLPVYFPGTYSYEEQGESQFGLTPPYCDQYYFIHMAWYYCKSAGKSNFLLQEIKGKKLVDRLEQAFAVVPSNTTNQLAYTSDAFRGVDFGFRDAITITGNLCFASLLRFKAAEEMIFLFTQLKNTAKAQQYKKIAASIQSSLGEVFMDDAGFLLASTQKGKQRDVWSTALAVYLGVLQGEQQRRASQALAKAYKEGTITYNGNIRHVPTDADFSETSAWEYSLAGKNLYQNGAYWGTPTGWVAYAIAQTNEADARQLVKEYIDDLRANDFRKDGGGAPYECFNKSGYSQNPIYLTTVACPYIVLKALVAR